MNKIKITCDSTCDLTPALYRQYGIEMAPLGVVLGDRLYRDGVDIRTADVFRYVKESGQLPKTSAVSVNEYTELFRKYTDQGCAVIHINISSEFSASHQNARLAAQELGNVYPIDSRSLSTGSGHLALRAAELAAEGLTAPEIVVRLEAMKEKLDVSFVLQTLDYLKKGGRCSGVVALGANLLQLRPEIEVVGGKMQVGRKYRGKLESSVADYIQGRLAGREDADTRRICITHSGLPEEVLQAAVEQVKNLHAFEEVLVTEAGCTISSHCGPNCVGVLFFKK